jgi:DNA-binding transcriptional MerR regulator
VGVDNDLTIDELARAADTKTSTVRLYQTRGLLPPPETRGRIGYYSSAHLARLRVIQRLQGRGYSLAAIKELLDNWINGTSLAAMLGVENEVTQLGEPVRLSPADFAALVPDGKVDEAVVRRAMSLGLASFDPETGEIHAPSRAFLEIGREFANYRIPPDRALDEFEALYRDVRTIADRFTTLFQEFIAEPTEPGPEVDEARRRFTALGAQAVFELAQHAFNEAQQSGDL